MKNFAIFVVSVLAGVFLVSIGIEFVNLPEEEILAVISKDEGKGHFREFVSECKKHYASIRFWALMNPDLEKALTRYGFYGGNDIDDFGDVVDVMDWTNL